MYFLVLYNENTRQTEKILEFGDDGLRALAEMNRLEDEVEGGITVNLVSARSEEELKTTWRGFWHSPQERYDAN
jgi:hypothetical protein